MRLPFLLPLLWSATLLTVQAQLNVSLQFSNETYLVDEPPLAVLSITNTAGRDITLKSGITDGSWCEIQLYAVRGQSPNYRPDAPTFPPVSIAAGQTARRSVNLAELFDLTGVGQYRARAAVSFGAARTQFVTPAVYFNVDPGHKLWATSVGIPEGRQNAEGTRTFSVFTLRRREGLFLYAKLENPQDGAHFPPYPLGRMLAAMPPQMQLDKNNDLYVFHAASDDSYILSQVDVANGRSGQAIYRSKTPRAGRPRLERQTDGRLAIVGGVRLNENDIAARAQPERSKLSERPAGF